MIACTYYGMYGMGYALALPDTDTNVYIYEYIANGAYGIYYPTFL